MLRWRGRQANWSQTTFVVTFKCYNVNCVVKLSLRPQKISFCCDVSSIFLALCSLPLFTSPLLLTWSYFTWEVLYHTPTSWSRSLPSATMKWSGRDGRHKLEWPPFRRFRLLLRRLNADTDSHFFIASFIFTQSTRRAAPRISFGKMAAHRRWALSPNPWTRYRNQSHTASRPFLRPPSCNAPTTDRPPPSNVSPSSTTRTCSRSDARPTRTRRTSPTRRGAACRAIAWCPTFMATARNALFRWVCTYLWNHFLQIQHYSLSSFEVTDKVDSGVELAFHSVGRDGTPVLVGAFPKEKKMSVDGGADVHLKRTTMASCGSCRLSNVHRTHHSFRCCCFCCFRSHHPEDPQPWTKIPRTSSCD